MKHNTSHKWVVTRQDYWGVDDPLVVEIAYGGFDYCNPDALCAKFPGEFEEYTDPREAVKAAFSIRDLWNKDGAQGGARVEVGFTHGDTIPFESYPTDQEIIDWSVEEFESLPKCVYCGDVMGDERYTLIDYDNDEEYCSENCAEMAYADLWGDEEDDEEEID